MHRSHTKVLACGRNVCLRYGYRGPVVALRGGGGGGQEVEVGVRYGVKGKKYGHGETHINDAQQRKRRRPVTGSGEKVESEPRRKERCGRNGSGGPHRRGVVHHRHERGGKGSAWREGRGVQRADGVARLQKGVGRLYGVFDRTLPYDCVLFSFLLFLSFLVFRTGHV